MKLLQVTPYPAYPPISGGSQRMRGLVSAQREDDEVRRFAQSPLSYPGNEDGPMTEIRDGYLEYRYKNRVGSIVGAILGRIRAPRVHASALLRVFKPKRLTEWVAWADVISVEYPWQYRCVYEMKEGETPIVYSSYDFPLELFSDLSGSVHGKIIRRKIRNMEQFALRTADLVVATSDRDKRLYLEEYDVSTHIHVAPSVTDRSNPGASETSDTSGSIRSANDIPRDALLSVFIGSRHWPNVTAVEHIVDIAGSLDSTFQFAIIGDVCEAFDDEPMPSNVHLLGFVDDLKECYSAADVALNPITEGAGTNVKVIEYFSYCLPVVTTPFGARGIPAEEGTHFVVAELPEFESVLTDVYRGEIDRERIGTNARRLVDERLNWEQVSEELFEEMRRL